MSNILTRLFTSRTAQVVIPEQDTPRRKKRIHTYAYTPATVAEMNTLYRECDRINKADQRADKESLKITRAYHEQRNRPIASTEPPSVDSTESIFVSKTASDYRVMTNRNGKIAFGNMIVEPNAVNNYVTGDNIIFNRKDGTTAVYSKTGVRINTFG